MPQWLQILLIVLLVVAFVLAVLYIVGRRLQKKADSQQGLIDSSKQVVSILVIDKKKMRISESNLPQMVQDQIPFYLKWRKMPLIKAKIGPQITTLMADEKIFKEIPVKRQVKVELAGIYIVNIKGKPKQKKSNSKTPIKKSLWQKTKDKVGLNKK